MNTWHVRITGVPDVLLSVELPDYFFLSRYFVMKKILSMLFDVNGHHTAVVACMVHPPSTHIEVRLSAPNNTRYTVLPGTWYVVFSSRH